MKNIRAYSLYSGSTGNAFLLEANGTCILIDAGKSAKALCAAIQASGHDPESIAAVFVTHEHSDHTKGIPMIAKHCSIPVYCQRAVAKELYLPLLSKSAQNAAALRGYDPDVHAHRRARSPHRKDR